MGNLIDRFGRKHNYLRLSITDKCNFNCFYCNPKSIKKCNKIKQDILSYEELFRIIKIFSSELEFNKFRFTGGEPLLRKGFIDFLGQVKELKNNYDFEMDLTTNGFLLDKYLNDLKLFGIDRINISIDTLQKNKFEKITGIDAFNDVMKAINNAKKIGFNPLKINTVVIKGVNDDEIFDFVEFAKNNSINVRFIEFMPFSTNHWENHDFIDYKKMRTIVESKYNLIPILNEDKSVAKNFRIKNSEATISFISSISEHFCSTCNRVRISSTGKFRLCLFTNGENSINFMELFRSDFPDKQIIQILKQQILYKWENHPDTNELKEMKSNNMLSIGG